MRLWMPIRLPVATMTIAAVASAGVAVGQEREAAPMDEALREHLGQRLRAELSISDAQVASILPRIEDLETARTETRSARTRNLGRLREAYDGGSDDATLQRLLDEVEASEREMQNLERKTLEQIDQGLSVRQRVQLRFFMQTLRRQMQEHVRQLRRDRAGPAGRVDRSPGSRPKERR